MGNHISQLQDKYTDTLRNPNPIDSPFHDETIKCLNLLKEMNQQFISNQSAKSVTDKKVFLRDSKKIHFDCKTIISILKSTIRELNDKHDWSYIRNYVDTQLAKQRNIKDLMLECTEMINRKRDLQQKMIVDKRDFETQSAKMKAQVAVLEKELATLTDSVENNTNVESKTVNAQEKSLCYLYQSKLNKLKENNIKIVTDQDRECKVHETQMQFYEKYHKNVHQTLETRKIQQTEDLEKLDQMIEELNKSVNEMTQEIDKSQKVRNGFWFF